MILVLETFVAAVLNTVLATVVWLRYQRKDAAWLLLGAVVLRTIIAVSALVYVAILFDVALAGSLVYLLRRRPTFETTREAIDQALESMAEGIAVLTAKGKVLYTNRAMEGHLNLRTGQAITEERL